MPERRFQRWLPSDLTCLKAVVLRLFGRAPPFKPIKKSGRPPLPNPHPN